MKYIIPVYGMHCVSCEVLMESEISKIPDVTVLKVSKKENMIEVDTDEKHISEIKKMIKKLGYHIEKQEERSKNTFLDLTIIILFFIIIGMLWFLWADLWLTQMMAFDQKSWLFIIFLIGIVASLSTCLAVTGGIVLGFGKYLDTSATFFDHLKIQGKFQLGRISGFMIGWAFLWALGSYITKVWNLNLILLGVTWIFLIFMWWHILWFFPSPSKFWISMPKSFGNKILSIQNPAFTPIIGALTFFLPCGFTQSMQIMAASSGSPIIWSLMMWIFALGTAPVLIWVWVWGSYLDGKKMKTFKQLVWVIVVYFGIFTLFNLTHFFTFWTPTVPNHSLENISFEQVTAFHNGYTMQNKEIFLKAWGNYKLNIIPAKNGIGCMTTLTIPGIDGSVHQVLAWKPIWITIVDAKPGKYNIICTTMGMKQGEIIIE